MNMVVRWNEFGNHFFLCHPYGLLETQVEVCSGGSELLHLQKASVLREYKKCQLKFKFDFPILLSQ